MPLRPRHRERRCFCIARLTRPILEERELPPFVAKGVLCHTMHNGDWSMLVHPSLVVEHILLDITLSEGWHIVPPNQHSPQGPFRWLTNSDFNVGRPTLATDVGNYTYCHDCSNYNCCCWLHFSLLWLH